MSSPDDEKDVQELDDSDDEPPNDVAEVSTEQTDPDKPELAGDEAYCTSCGEAIKKEAEMCPHCGVAQDTGGGGGDMSKSRKYELQKVARKDGQTVMIVSFLITPLGYFMVGKLGLALLNLFTLNYFFLGPLVVPFHTRNIIRDARQELEVNGENW